MSSTTPKPVWDRGDPIDADMLAFTIGDDWSHDRRLVPHDIRGSLAHVAGLARAGLIDAAAHDAIKCGLEELLRGFEAGEWTLEPTDEDVHSALERRLTEAVGEPGERMHTGRSRNEQIAVDMRLWLREAVACVDAQVAQLCSAGEGLARGKGELPLPGYTHLRRAMPSSIAHWIGAYVRAFADDALELDAVRVRIAECPLGSGSGYGVPLDLERAFVAAELGFDGPEEPVTYAQHARGRAELAYATALEGLALDLGKLAFDLWLFTSEEFGFARLPTAWTTGSSLMPHKRNPDVLELVRAHCRQVVTDRQALFDVVRDLPSGYHRDFQLIKPPLFRAHDRMTAMLPLVTRLLGALELDEAALRRAAADPSLNATARALERVRSGQSFRAAYRAESRDE